MNTSTVIKTFVLKAAKMWALFSPKLPEVLCILLSTWFMFAFNRKMFKHSRASGLLTFLSTAFWVYISIATSTLVDLK